MIIIISYFRYVSNLEPRVLVSPNSWHQTLWVSEDRRPNPTQSILAISFLGNKLEGQTVWGLGGSPSPLQLTQHLSWHTRSNQSCKSQCADLCPTLPMFHDVVKTQCYGWQIQEAMLVSSVMWGLSKKPVPTKCSFVLLLSAHSLTVITSLPFCLDLGFASY